MSNAIDDKELNEYLSGNTQFSSRYRAIETGAVPPELDSLVLANAATDNVTPINSTKSRRSKSLGFWMRMSVPVALAASFVLVISIMIESGVRYDAVPTKTMEAPSIPATSTKEIRAEAAIDRAQQPAALRVNAAEKPQAPNTQVKLERAAPPAKSSAPNSVAQSSDLNKTVVSGQMIRGHADEVALPIDAISRDEAVQSIAPASPSPTVAALALSASKTAAAEAKAVPSTSVDSRNKARRAADTTGLEEIVVTGQRRQNTNTNSGAGPRGTIRPPSVSERELSDAELAAQEREAIPATWLTYIRELRAIGDARAADRQWQRFVRAYPTYAVDEVDSARPKK